MNCEYIINIKNIYLKLYEQFIWNKLMYPFTQSFGSRHMQDEQIFKKIFLLFSFQSNAFLYKNSLEIIL